MPSHTHTRIQIHTHTHTHKFKYAYVHTHTHTHTHAHTHTCTHVHTHTHTHTHTCIDIHKPAKTHRKTQWPLMKKYSKADTTLNNTNKAVNDPNASFCHTEKNVPISNYMKPFCFKEALVHHHNIFQHMYYTHVLFLLTNTQSQSTLSGLGISCVSVQLP